VAEARVTVNATLARPTFAPPRLVVTITNSRAFTARSRPRAVTVRHRRRSYRLRRVARPARAGAAATTSLWQSSARAEFSRLLGKRVAINVRMASGKATFRRKVTRPKPAFTPPKRRVTGAEAFRRIGRYFINSTFTNCPEGWPACASERRVSHCAGGGIDGDWRQLVLPASVASPQVGRYHVTDASQNPDGSWGITYQVTLDSGVTGYYSWIVRADQTAIGVYALGEDMNYMYGYRWQQPARC
jgi:hypothetical protein